MPAAAQTAEFDYKLACPDTIESPTGVRLIQMCDAIRKETNGRMRVTIFLNSVLGSASSMLSQLRLGAIQFLSSNYSTYSPVVPLVQIPYAGFAFQSEAQPLDLLDGALGAYIRREFLAKGMYTFEKTLLTGFRDITTSSKPVKTGNDFAGLRIRVIPAAIFVDLFKTLGASPVPVDVSELYTALQTHVVDAQETGLIGIEETRLYEVQKYLSITNHAWASSWLTANAAVWNALPADLQAVVKHNADKYILLARNDTRLKNQALLGRLQRQGLIANTADLASIRPRLGAYYGRWKAEFGSTAWSLLEQNTGPLG